MKPPRAGERVVFEDWDAEGKKRCVGTAMTNQINGLVLVALHTDLATNLLDVFAVRLDAIVAVDEANEPQEARR